MTGISPINEASTEEVGPPLTGLTWRALVLGKGQQAQNAESAIQCAYSAGDTDEFIRPILLPSFSPIGADDPVIFFNFRKDRPRQIVAALSDPAFTGFDRGDTPLADKRTSPWGG